MKLTLNLAFSCSFRMGEMLVEWKKGQDKIKETLGDEYMDYNLVMAALLTTLARSLEGK